MIGEELYFKVACYQGEEQDKRRQHFDTVALALIGLAGALIGIMAFTVSEWVWWSIGLAIMTVIGCVGVALACLLIIWARRWEIQPPLRDIKRHITEYEDKPMILWAANQMSSAIENNERPLHIKASCQRIACGFLALQIIALGILIISGGCD